MSVSSKQNITIKTPVITSATNIPQRAITTSIANSSGNNKKVKTATKPKKTVAETLGIGESKKGDPSEPNPFESTGDLLQELE